VFRDSDMRAACRSARIPPYSPYCVSGAVSECLAAPAAARLRRPKRAILCYAGYNRSFFDVSKPSAMMLHRSDSVLRRMYRAAAAILRSTPLLDPSDPGALVSQL
jgi:hypothetical protein